MKAKILTFVRGLKNGTPPRFQSYLKSLTLLLGLMLSVNMWGADPTATWNISGVNTTASNAIVNTTLKTSSVTPTTETGVWTAVSTSNSYAGTSSGAQLGSSSYSFNGTIALSGTDIPSNATISKVSVTCKSGGSYTLGCKVGETALGSSITVNSTTEAAKNFTGSVKGNNIILTLSTTVKKYFNVSKIVVTYTAPAADLVTTLYLSEAGVRSDNLKGSYKVGDKYTLPDEDKVTATCGDKKFVGWSTGEVDSPTIPTSNFYEPGAEVTLAANNTFYAVFADAQDLGGNAYKKVSSVSAGTYVLVSEKTTNTFKYMPNTESSGSNPSLGSGITMTTSGGVTKLTNSVTDAMLWDLTSTGTTNEYYIRPKGSTTIGLGTTNSTGENIRISSTYKNTKWTITTSTSYNWQFKNNNTTAMYLAVYADDAWRNYKDNTTNQNGKFYLFKEEANISYFNYTTTCSSSSCSIEPELIIDEAISKTTADVDFSLEVLSENVGAGQTIVLNSSNPNVATIVEGKIHIVGAGTTDITASVAADGDYCSAISNACKLTVSKAKYTVTWMASGFEFAKNENVEDGSALTLPSSSPTSSDCDDKKIFRGWTTQAEYSHATAAPADMFTKAGNKKVTGNVTYYAVFSDATPGGAPMTATLNASGLETGTYKEGSKKDDKNNLWSYYAAVTNQSGNLYFGLNADDKNYHIASPLFSGKITAISMKAWNGSSTEVRNVLLCSDNTTAKPASGDITEISIAKSEQLTTTYEANLTNAGEFSQFYIYVKKPLGVNEIAVTYSPITYSNYTTVCTPPTYSITFDGNGATSGEMSKIENIAKGGSQKITKNAFEKIGYSFTDWKDQDNKDVVDEATITNITKNITLTAQWEAKTIYVTLDKNGSESDGLVTVVYDNTSIEEIVHVADWAAHELQGYFTESTGGSKVLNADGTFAGNVAGWIVDGKWAKAAEDATLYAQWLAQQKCTLTDYDLDGCTADAGNVTEVNVNAEGVTLNYILADNHTWEGSETYITMGTADLEKGTDYTFETGTITFLKPITGNINVMISCPWSPATLTLSAIEHEYPFGDGLKVNDVITLPSTVNYQASGKTFVGWSSETILTEGSMPTKNYWAKGASYTIQSATDKLYAVYATETKGAESWVIATGIDVLHDGDKVAFTSAKDEQNYASAGRSYNNEFLNCFLDPVAITLTNNVVTSGADKIVPITLGGNATDGWTMYMDDYGYIVGSYALNKDGNRQSNTTLFSNTPKVIQGISINNYTYEATVKVSGDSVMRYNSGSPRFSIYKSGQTAIKLLKQNVEPSTFEKYTTSGSIHVDAPTFDELTKPGTFTDAEHWVIINVPTSATVYYTLDGTEPTEASDVYDEQKGITLTATATIKAKAFIEGVPSETLEGTFTIHNYNTVAALINGAEHNKAAVLNLNEVYVLGVYTTAKQIFVQEGTKGAIITLSESVPEGIKAGVKLTATVSGTYIFTAHNRPQMNGCTLSNVSVSGENQRPASIPVLGAIDATTAADNLLTLVQINDVYSISKSYNDIVMNSASDGTGTSYNVNNLLSAVKNTLPEKELACNVIGIFYKKISNNVEEYSIVPVLESDFALVGDAPDAELPVVDFVGGTQAAPIEVAVDKKITITKPSTGFSGSYSFNGAEAVSMTASSYQVQITNTTAAESLTLTSTRPYYNDNSVTYYYKANPALNEYDITYPLVQTYVGITGVASAIPGTDVVMTGTRKKEHYYPGDVTVTRTDDETVKIDVTRTEVSATEATYSFKMPAYPVTVQIGYTKDPTYSITYQTGGKQTTSGSAPTEGVKYEDEEVTLKPNTWTVNNFTFDKWKVVYETGDAEPKEQHEVEVIDGKFIMPPYNVKVIAQWVAVYAVTYAKGTATSATGSVTEDPQKAGATIKLKANAFKATGYSFTGWKASTDGEIYQPDADFTMPAQAVTFTAQWEGAEYTKDGAWEIVTNNDQLEVGKFYVIACKSQEKVMTATQAGSTNKYLTGAATTFTDDDVLGEKAIIKKTDLPANAVIFELGGESDAWTLMNVATEKYYHTGDKNNPVWLDNARAWETISYNKIQAWESKSYQDTTLQFNASGGFRPYTSSQKAVQLYRFYPTARKVYFSANAGEDIVTNMPEWQRANPSTNMVTIPNVTPARTGYTFTKWNSAQNGTGAHSAQPNETITLWQAECTLHAIWAKNTPLLTIADVEHGTIQAKPYSMDVIVEGGTANVEYQKTIVISHTDDDEEYAFKTWKIYKTGDESVVIEPVVGQTSTTFDMPDYPVTVSAIYESKTSIEYTLTYDANGGEGTMTGNPFTQHWNDYITVSDNKDGDNDIFTKTLCEFNGWNTKEDGTGASYAAGAHFYMKSDVTLYAQWKGSGATYRLDKNYDGNIFVNVGAAPQGSTATCVNTNESAQIDQATTGNSITITLTGYAGKVVTNITADIKANSSGNSGKLDITVGGVNVFDKTYEDLDAQNKSQYQERSFADYGFGPVLVKENEDIIILVRSLVDKSAYIQNITIEYEDIPEETIVRSGLTPGQYTTYCEPQTVLAGTYTGATFWNIESKTTMDDGRLSSITIVQHDDALVAGVPYIMLPESDVLTGKKCSKAVAEPAAEDAHNGLVGVFATTMFDNFSGDAATIDALAAARGIYIISDGTLYLCGNNCGVYANRAYILNSAIEDKSATTPPAAPRRVIGNPNGTPTTLNGLNGNQSIKAQKALIDGHIYILRDNKMYNAQGLFVK